MENLKQHQQSSFQITLIHFETLKCIWCDCKKITQISFKFTFRHAFIFGKL